MSDYDPDYEECMGCTTERCRGGALLDIKLANGKTGMLCPNCLKDSIKKALAKRCPLTTLRIQEIVTIINKGPKYIPDLSMYSKSTATGKKFTGSLDYVHGSWTSSKRVTITTGEGEYMIEGPRKQRSPNKPYKLLRGTVWIYGPDQEKCLDCIPGSLIHEIRVAEWL